MTDLKKLTAPFPSSAVRQRQGGGGKMLDYLPGHVVIHRLNDATENCWNFSVDRIERTEIDAANTLLMAYVTLEIPGLGRRSHVGVQAINARGGEDLAKGAITDALKKAATLFGVGLELYGPDYEAGEIAEQRAPQTATRARSTTQNTVPMITDRQLVELADLKERKGLTAEGLRKLAGKDDARDLTLAEANQLIAEIKGYPDAAQAGRQGQLVASGDPGARHRQ